MYSYLVLSPVIDFCKRPFASTAEMNAALIANFQACVRHDDDLWILGDFAFGRAEDTAQFESWFHSLPGRKHLIIGNHDDEAVVSLPWASTEYMAEIKDGDQSLVLCHYAPRPFPYHLIQNDLVRRLGHVAWRATLTIVGPT